MKDLAALLASVEPTDCPVVLAADVEMSLLAANDPVFSDLKADDYKGYLRFRIATALPNIIGPEMHGRVFGFHPQVLVNSYKSLFHQQINLGHALKAYGAYRDRIIGGIVGVQVANAQRTGGKQKMVENVADAQYLDVVASFYKLAEGVKDMLGNHASARQKQSVSIEAVPLLSDLFVFDPRDKSIVTLDAAMEMYPKLITMHKERGIQIGKVDGIQLAFATGGEDGSIPLRGVGVTPNPAEKRTARIIDLKASSSDEVLFAAMAVHEWEPGMEVCWTPLHYRMDAGAGTVVEVIADGTVKRHGLSKVASASDPLLDIRVHGKGGMCVIRHASSLRKKNQKRD